MLTPEFIPMQQLNTRDDPMSRTSHLMVCIISEFPVLPNFHSMAISILSTNNHMLLETKYILKKPSSPIYLLATQGYGIEIWQ